MIDFAKKIRKSCSDDLLPGEEVVAGTFVQPAGALRRQIAFGAVGGAVGALAGEALAKRRRGDEDHGEGINVDIPAGKAVLGLTRQRLLVFGHSALTGKPKGLNAAFPIEQVQAVDFEANRFTGKLVIRFADDTSIDFDVMKTVKPGPFVEAFHEITGR